MRKLAIFAFSFAAAAAAYIWLLPTAAAVISAGVLMLASIVLYFKKIERQNDSVLQQSVRRSDCFGAVAMNSSKLCRCEAFAAWSGSLRQR